MPVDPRMFAPADLVGSYSRGLQVHQQQQEAQGRKRLGDLLPQAMGYPGVTDESGATQQGAMREIAGIDPRLFMQLDERQKQQAAAELDDVTAAVRWADTPEKWQQVQQYYGSHGHDVSAYPFESRESVVLQLGKMGEYIKSAPKANEQPSDVREYEYAKGQGYDGSYVDFKGEFAAPLIFDVNGDGANDMVPRGRGRQQQGGPRPGQVEDGYRFKGGDPADPNNWHQIGGQTPQASGPFPGSGY